MKTSHLVTITLATLGLTLGLATAASAQFEWCFTLQTTGEEICLPVHVEYIPIRFPGPPDPGPYLPIDIRELSSQLMDALGTSQTKWVVADASGQQVFMFDFEAQQAFDLSEQVGN